VKKKPVATRFGEDQLKLASLSSGVEVALVVSASINWGKRCPHFLAETRPPFFATSLRANGKNGHARRRGKKTLFFRRRTSRRQVTEEETSPSLRFRLRGE